MSLQVLKKTCSPKQCELECVDVCPQNKKGKIAIKVEKEIAEINQGNCISCLQCVYVCPFEAIEVEIKDKKRLTPKVLKTTSKKTDEEEQVFEINEDVYERFNEKYTIFNRRMWDEDFEGFKRPIYEKAHERSLLGIDGYSDLEQAAADGAWAIENLVSMREFMMERVKTLNEEDAKAMREQQKKRDMIEVNYDIQKPPQYDVKNPQEMTSYLKKVASFYGADLIGIAPFDPKWIYSQDRMDRKYIVP